MTMSLATYRSGNIGINAATSVSPVNIANVSQANNNIINTMAPTISQILYFLFESDIIIVFIRFLSFFLRFAPKALRDNLY